MQRNDLLTLLDREAEILTSENNHSAAALMRAAAVEIRSIAASAAVVHYDKPLSPEMRDKLRESFSLSLKHSGGYIV